MVYVNDLLISVYDIDLINSVQELLKENFVVKELGEVKNFLNIKISRNSNGKFELNQTYHIINIIKRFNSSESNSICTLFEVDSGLTGNSSIDLNLQNEYKRIIGCLMYLSQWTSPDITFTKIIYLVF